MITYLTGYVITFFTLIFLVRKLNKKLHLYDEGDRIFTSGVIVICSLGWFVIVPIILIFAFFYFVVKNSAKLLK